MRSTAILLMALMLTAPLVLVASTTVDAMEVRDEPMHAGAPCFYVDPYSPPDVVYVDTDC
jgi:hypothetical protein